MSLQSEEIKVNSLDTITSTTMSLGVSSSTISLGSSSTLTTVGSLDNFSTIKPQVFNLTTQTWNPTIAQLLDATTIVCNYSLSNPSTSNSVITINLPIPTAELEGVIITFRKIRGVLNTASSNFLFNCNGHMLSFNASLTTTGQPGNQLNVAATIQRLLILGYSGTYYYMTA